MEKADKHCFALVKVNSDQLHWRSTLFIWVLVAPTISSAKLTLDCCAAPAIGLQWGCHGLCRARQHHQQLSGNGSMQQPFPDSCYQQTLPFWMGEADSCCKPGCVQRLVNGLLFSEAFCNWVVASWSRKTVLCLTVLPGQLISPSSSVYCLPQSLLLFPYFQFSIIHVLASTIP